MCRGRKSAAGRARRWQLCRQRPDRTSHHSQRRGKLWTTAENKHKQRDREMFQPTLWPFVIAQARQARRRTSAAHDVQNIPGQTRVTLSQPAGD